jgi:hypothetical protein
MGFAELSLRGIWLRRSVRGAGALFLAEDEIVTGLVDVAKGRCSWMCRDRSTNDCTKERHWAVDNALSTAQ